jgi:ketosteroid isomerase-like protein
VPKLLQKTEVLMNLFLLAIPVLLPVILTLPPTVVSGQAAPSSSAVGQIRRIENAYAETFNRKDTSTVTSMYARDAIFIRGDGSVLVGQDTIRKMIAAEAPHWPKISIEAESTRVNGQTAWESGTVRFKGALLPRRLMVERTA